MSNRFSGNMIVVDTTDTQVGGKNAGIGPEGPLSIKAIKWVGTAASTKDIAQADKLTILMGYKAGDIVIAPKAQLSTPPAVVYSVEFGSDPWKVPGLYVEDIDGGELQIFLA